MGLDFAILIWMVGWYISAVLIAVTSKNDDCIMTRAVLWPISLSRLAVVITMHILGWPLNEAKHMIEDWLDRQALDYWQRRVRQIKKDPWYR